MVQGYYTLAEAAQFLGMAPDELKQMAQRNQIRSFQDRGTLRFRLQDVQELARRRGDVSDPELVLGEAPPKSPTPRPESPRTPTPKTPRPAASAPAASGDVFDFDLGSDSVDIGHELFAKIDQPSSKSKKAGSGAKPRTPPPPPKGTDSDVRLVAQGEDFSISVGSDSDVKLVTGDSDIKRAVPGVPPSGRKSPSKLGPVSPAPPRSPARKPSSKPDLPQPADSGVRLVPMDSDSDVRIVGAGGSDDMAIGEGKPPSPSDSDIRLVERDLPPSMDESGEGQMLTEEINLDEEIRRQDEALRQLPSPSKLKPRSGLHLPTSSPFELSDSDLDHPSQPGLIEKPDSSDFELTSAPAAGVKDDSSDFDVAPLAGESDDFSLELSSDEGVLTGKEPGLSGPSSGISLENPVDAGISLEEGADSVDFDLSLDAGATPRPVRSPSIDDSDSGFELSLDDSGQGQISMEDSEFELTLDDSGQLGAIADSPTEELSGEKDIFETDFEVPGLDDSSQEARLDTDLESSDFDIALDDSDLAVEDESGSQVVALDEEAVDESAETVAGEEIEIEVEEEGFGDLEGEEPDVEVEEDEEAVGPVRERIVEKMIEPAPWGAMPVIFMFPCVLIMILVGLMGFELIQSSTGYKQAGFITKTFGGILGQNVK